LDLVSRSKNKVVAYERNLSDFDYETIKSIEEANQTNIQQIFLQVQELYNNTLISPQEKQSTLLDILNSLIQDNKNIDREIDQYDQKIIISKA